MNSHIPITKIYPLLIICMIMYSFSSCDVYSTPVDAFEIKVSNEIPIVVAGAAFLLSGDYLMSHVEVPDPATLNKRNVPAFDRFACRYNSERASDLSNLTRDIDLYFPVLASSTILWKKESGKLRTFLYDMLMYVESVQISNGLTAIAKGAFGRSRPYAYNASVPVEDRMEKNAALSLWSGHTAQAFNGAVFSGYVFQKRYPESKLRKPLWILGISLATTTAVLRVRAGKHFPTDVLAGAAAGSLTGWLIPLIHEKSKDTLLIHTSARGCTGLKILYFF